MTDDAINRSFPATVGVREGVGMLVSSIKIFSFLISGVVIVVVVDDDDDEEEEEEEEEEEDGSKESTKRVMEEGISEK
jgi:hypothetical protein